MLVRPNLSTGFWGDWGDSGGGLQGSERRGREGAGERKLFFRKRLTGVAGSGLAPSASHAGRRSHLNGIGLDQHPPAQAVGQQAHFCAVDDRDKGRRENAIRPTALGKKNWLFIGEVQAGDRGAIFYTVVESCRRRGIDPCSYLRDVLTRLPRMTIQQVRKRRLGREGNLNRMERRKGR